MLLSPQHLVFLLPGRTGGHGGRLHYKYMEVIGCESVKSSLVTEEFVYIIVTAYFNGMFEVMRHNMERAAALSGFLLRVTQYVLALSISHRSTFAILKSIRGRVLEKRPRMPLGTILDTSSGQMKQIIVDQVESMVWPLAHLLPVMSANVLGPVCILIYLPVLDWRMALLSLVSIPVGMVFMMAV